MTKAIHFGSYDGQAVRFVDDEAWLLWDDGRWHEMNPADAVFEAALLSEPTFRKTFGDVPALPSAAFNADPWRGQRRAADQSVLDHDAKQGGGHAQHKIARRTAPNGSEPDPVRYAAALARAKAIYRKVIDNYPPEWRAVFDRVDTGPGAHSGWRSPLV
jgi:hypothetical protein